MQILPCLNIDEPLTRIDSTEIGHYVRDALGSIIALINDSGGNETTYVYDAFGNSTVIGEQSANPFQFTGRENDSTVLYHYRYRYYSPEMQRFISEDPIRLKGGINYFSYVQNNPINWIDPEGLAPKATPNFQPPTNPPQLPPQEVPPGWRVRVMPPTAQYPEGYWKLEKPMLNDKWQPIDPSTMKPGSRCETHVLFLVSSHLYHGGKYQ